MIPMRVESVGVVPGNRGLVIVLREVNGSRLLVMEIGPLEANSIAMELEGMRPPRPMTHDLFVDALEQLNVRVARATVVELRDSTFFATLTLETSEGIVNLDSRPSDAIAIALRSEAPIYCLPGVLEEAGISDEGEPQVH